MIVQTFDGLGSLMKLLGVAEHGGDLAGLNPLIMLIVLIDLELLRDPVCHFLQLVHLQW